MAGTSFRLFVILLCLSHLTCLKAVPVTRTENLMQDVRVPLTLENTLKVTTERMDLELHDYAPSGANGRHTPRGP